MKQIIQVAEIDGEGLEAMLGKRALFMCACYFYCGNVVGVNSTCVKIDDCHLVYETGAWSDKSWKDAQKIGDGHYVQIAAIESFREVTK